MTKPFDPTSHVRCPRCNRRQKRQGPDTLYWCEVCRCQFDDDPDEGGDYCTDPTRRIVREEGRRQRSR